MPVAVTTEVKRKSKKIEALENSSSNGVGKFKKKIYVFLSHAEVWSD
jgi:hypothetical protein